MRRTQVLLHERQYDELRARASRQGKSVSALLREIVADYLRGRSRLRLMEGVAVGLHATDHDLVIYDEE